MLFTVKTAESFDEARIAVQPLGQPGKPRILIQGGTHARWAPSGDNTQPYYDEPSRMYDYAVAQAIRDAVDYTPCRIISMSLGGEASGGDPILTSAVAHAQSKGAVVIAAAGNA